MAMQQEREMRRKLIRGDAAGLGRRASVSRRAVLKGGTVATLGGATLLSQFLAACGGRGERKTGDSSAPLSGQAQLGAGTQTGQAQAAETSPYELVEEYHWRKLKWGGTPTRGGEIIHGGASNANWDLMKATTLTPAPPYYNGLYYFRLDQGSDLNGQTFAPDLAEKTENTPDYQTWIFKLPANVYFHDLPPVNGRLMSAEDVVFSYQRYMDTSVWSTPLGFIDKISAPDKQTVRIDTKFPYFPVPNIVGMPYYLIFAREHFEGNQERWNQQPIGTGPFMVTNFKFREVVEAVRHPKYHQKDSNGIQLPYADKFTGRYYSDINASIAALRAGERDTIPDGISYLDVFNEVKKSLPDSYFVVSPHWATYQTWIMFQWNNPLFKDPRVRRALSMAIDRKAIVAQTVGGAATAPTPIPYDQMGMKTAPWWDYLPPTAQHNPQEAKQLMSAAGHANGFKTKFLTSSASNPAPEVLAVQKAWRDLLNVDMSIDGQDPLIVLSTIQKKEFSDISAQGGVVATEPYALSKALFYPGEPQNWGNVDDAQLTQMIDKMKTTTVKEEREKLAQEMNKRVFEETLQMWIDGRHVYSATRPWLHTIAQSLYTQIDNWGGTSWRHVWIDGNAPNNRGGKA
jgi:peptide/nickel transport system substrate-binding protein